MMLFHGTTENHANIIVNPTGPPHNVDVTIGGGELGRGFYTGESIWHAAKWARGVGKKSGGNHKVIEITLNNRNVMALNIFPLNYARVRQTNLFIKLNNLQNSFLFGADLITGPIVIYPNVNQQKFESSLAQSVINNSRMNVI